MFLTGIISSSSGKSLAGDESSLGILQLDNLPGKLLSATNNVKEKKLANLSWIESPKTKLTTTTMNLCSIRLSNIKELIQIDE